MKTELIKKAMLAGVDMNHLAILLIVADGITMEDIYTKIRFSGMVSLMMKKKMLCVDNGRPAIAEEGKKVLDTVGDIFSSIDSNVLKDIPTVVPYDYVALQQRLKDRLKEITGSSQYFLRIQGSKYPYVPSAQDLKDKVEKFKHAYNMHDMAKIERCLTNHLRVRNQKMIYYIMKEISPTQKKSDLSADYDSLEDVDEPVSSGETFI